MSEVTWTFAVRRGHAPTDFDIDDNPPEVYQAVLKRDVEKWAQVVKEAKVKVE